MSEVRVRCVVDTDDVLVECSGADVVKHFEDSDDVDSLLDAIGIDKVKEYFNLTEVKDEG